MNYALDPYEVRVAAGVGRMRHEDANGPSDWGNKTDAAGRLALDILSVKAEIAVARMLNLAWTGMARRNTDVGNFLEVRAIQDRSRRLTARRKDENNTPCVLAFVEGDTVHALGWETFGVVRRDGVKMAGGAHGDYYLLDVLRPMEMLFGIVEWRREYETAEIKDFA
tara:strand:- start:63 stop:563 length:501 start_codon:yes stop_codon:yes gene_type:complete